MTDRMQDFLAFSDEDIEAAAREEKLLSLELEFTSRCNLRCAYCYSGGDLFRRNELNLEEMYDVISQAKALGARKIIYVGAGEPLLDRKLCAVVEYSSKLGLDHILFTNGTLIDPDIAAFLYDHGVGVVTKMTSRKPEVYDWLSGVPGAYATSQRGMGFLIDAGYPDGDHVLGIEAVVCRQNLVELPDLWRWARNNNYIPYVECLTRQGLAKDREDLFPGTQDIRILFEELSAIDAQEYGLFWTPHPPIAAFSCRRHLYSCTVTSRGFVRPCVGIDLKIGNVREDRLAHILASSSRRKELVCINDTIKGPCSQCELKSECYGCRGTAYGMTGDYLASDPTCWRVQEAYETESRAKQKASGLVRHAG
ncbi:MAG: radical SAM protein [Kiritimatiellia bacterium]